MSVYYRPIPVISHAYGNALPLAGGWERFLHAERLERGRPAEIVPIWEIPDDRLEALTAPRPAIAGMAWDAPRLMGIVNATPDSFSDGGLYETAEAAIAQGRRLIDDGADWLDIGGESTRPGAEAVPVEEEVRRVVPVIEGLVGTVPISIDTRKAAVAKTALEAGAGLVNDVSAMTYDPEMAAVVAAAGASVCLMHAAGDPKVMQDDPRYEDVLLDVYDALEARRDAAEAAGIARARIVLDPGIGFGKTLEHNLALLRGLSLFHGLGCVLLLGASRKRFIGVIGSAESPADRVHGSVAVALHGIRQGVQISRVHDMAATRQAVALERALQG
ncbi:dihydropteroate synthase [Aestuariibius sp. 2305UL40-4]|uniref:dihydropteroate synthase n=1 Tax=Aestuariibius violaceus TaxID=3234132 RepID=UPI00345E9BD4